MQHMLIIAAAFALGVALADAFGLRALDALLGVASLALLLLLVHSRGPSP